MFTKEDGLQGETISSVVALSDNEVWIGYNDVVSVTHAKLDESGAHAYGASPLGLGDSGARFKESHLVQRHGWDRDTFCPTGDLQRMSHADGLVWDDISPWTGMREEADGSFVIATSRGLARYRPSDIRQCRGSTECDVDIGDAGGAERPVKEDAGSAGVGRTLAVQFSPLVLETPAVSPAAIN